MRPGSKHTRREFFLQSVNIAILQIGLGRYVRKKSLEPLESYVPPVLQARIELQKCGDIMGMPAPLPPVLLQRQSVNP
jgi:hypothetical protein